jgi:hypothetical protein
LKCGNCKKELKQIGDENERIWIWEAYLSHSIKYTILL